MEPGTVALITAIVGLVAGIIGLWSKLNTVDENVQEVHVLVNDRMTEALTRIDQLNATLEAAGIESPERPKRG